MGDQAIGGAVDVLWDGNMPRTFTGRARTTLSGGQYVVVSGAANCVGSVASLFNPGSIIVDLIHDTNYANGINLINVGSNETATIATRGTYIATCGGAEGSGGAMVHLGSDTVQYVVPDVRNTGDKDAYSGTMVGRMITAADSGTTHYCLVDFSF